MKTNLLKINHETTRLLIACLLAPWIVPLAATSQEVNQPKEIIPKVQMDNVPLLSAIQALARQAELNYIFDPRLSRSAVGPDGKSLRETSVTVLWTNVTADEALTTLLNQHHLTMVSNPATSIARITLANQATSPIVPSQVGAGTNPVIPLVAMDGVPLADVIRTLAKQAQLKVSLDPSLSAPSSAPGGGTLSECLVSVRWKRVTARQALTALLDNYDLVMVPDPAGSSARITTKAQAEAASAQ